MKGPENVMCYGPKIQSHCKKTFSSMRQRVGAGKGEVGVLGGGGGGGESNIRSQQTEKK